MPSAALRRDEVSTPFAVLAAAVADRSLSGAQAAALVQILAGLEIWSTLDARAATDRPEHARDVLARVSYRLGLAEHALSTYRTEMAGLVELPPPSVPPYV